ncbi:MULTISPECIES: hypothetical protein [unclassified Streptomyces]|uniref:hypothetical protein n=1 Tax=unclassified Streptomyces TaxID=2593676 RepID=UPI00292D8C9C|nr:hypothetical protein [Streptomyces sp. ST1015]
MSEETGTPRKGVPQGRTGAGNPPEATAVPAKTPTGMPTGTPAAALKTGEPREKGYGSPLIPRDECDKLELKMRHALAGFVDEPREAVAEADQVLEELATRFTEAITRRRRTVRGAWQAGDGGAPATGDTEQLRLALRDYRELCDRLLHV